MQWYDRGEGGKNKGELFVKEFLDDATEDETLFRQLSRGRKSLGEV